MDICPLNRTKKSSVLSRENSEFSSGSTVCEQSIYFWRLHAFQISFADEKRDNLSFLKANLSIMHGKALAPQIHIPKWKKYFLQWFKKLISTSNLFVRCLVLGFFFSWYINLEISVHAVQRDIQQEILKQYVREATWMLHCMHIQPLEFLLLVGVPLMSIESISQPIELIHLDSNPYKSINTKWYVFFFS